MLSFGRYSNNLTLSSAPHISGFLFLTPLRLLSLLLRSATSSVVPAILDLDANLASAKKSSAARWLSIRRARWVSCRASDTVQG